MGRAGARSPGVGRLVLALVLAGAAAVAVAFQHGFTEPVLPHAALVAMQVGLAWLALVVGGDVRWRVLSRARWTTRGAWAVEGLLALSAVLESLDRLVVAEVLVPVIAVALAIRLNSRLARTLANPSGLFPISFLVLIAVSAALLKLPAATPPGQPIGWIDAVFTATSSVCVTGLVVRDTASGFTGFGQAVIAASIQLGGLGVMIFGSTLALLFGARLSVRENLTLSGALNEYPAHRISRFVWFIVLATLVIEAVGALAMAAAWPGHAPLPHRLWMSCFHSISAFCNAGFDITGGSMVPLRHTVIPYMVVMPLIVMGGLGFIVLEELWTLARVRLQRVGARRRLSTHSRLALITTVALLVGGAAVIMLAQAKVPGTGVGQRVLDAAFMSTTARTAGFNSVPMDDLAPGSRLGLMALMVVGGSPGSTAGGIKTVVLAVLVLSAWATIRGRDEVEVFGRALPDALVKKAATLAFGLVALVVGVCLLLDLTERIAFEPLVFEVLSAATTTGLSLGATTELSPWGRCVISATMFLGRVGPLAFIATVLVGTTGSAIYRLPRDTVSLG